MGQLRSDQDLHQYLSKEAWLHGGQPLQLLAQDVPAEGPVYELHLPDGTDAGITRTS